MSRCFSFPPPGYEVKIRIDDEGSLEKEKQKDKKKHKKKKREHAEKNKDRSKSKDIGESGRNWKHNEDYDENDREKDRSKPNEKNNEEYNENGRDKDGKNTSRERRIEVQGETSSEVGLQAGEVRDTKFLEELYRSIREDKKGTGNQMCENFNGKTQRGAEGICSNSVAMAFNNKGKGKENNEQNYRNNGWAEEQKNGYVDRGTKNVMVLNISRLHQRKTEGETKQTERDYVKDKDRAGDDQGGDKQKYRDSENKSNGMDKSNKKGKEKTDKMKSKVNPRTKEQNYLQESGKNYPMSTLRINSWQLPKDSNMNAAATDENLRKRKGLKINGILLGNGAHPCKRPASSSRALEENGKITAPAHAFDGWGAAKDYNAKAEEVKINHKMDAPTSSTGNGTCPCKRPAFSSQAYEENGKITDLVHALDRWGAAKNYDAKAEEEKINHKTVEAPSSSSTGLRCSPVTIKHASEKTEASTELEHPDSEYLSTILSVPKMEKLSEFDGEDWLFNTDSLNRRKPQVKSRVIEEALRVWEKALWIESTNTYALPYVIPY